MRKSRIPYGRSRRRPGTTPSSSAIFSFDRAAAEAENRAIEAVIAVASFLRLRYKVVHLVRSFSAYFPAASNVQILFHIVDICSGNVRHFSHLLTALHILFLLSRRAPITKVAESLHPLCGCFGAIKLRCQGTPLEGLQI